MHRHHFHQNRTMIRLAKSLTACLMLGLLATGTARADCGCTDDGHGSPKISGTAGQLSWLSALLGLGTTAPRNSAAPMRDLVSR